MPTDFLLELAATNARAMRAFLKWPEGAFSPATAVKLMLRESKLLLDFISGCRDLLRDALEETALEGTSFRRSCEALADGLDTFLGAAPMIRESIQNHSRPADRAAQREEVARQEAQAREARQSVAEWLEVLNRPRPPIDLKKLEEQSRADHAAGRYVRVETYEDLFGDAPEAWGHCL